MVARAAAEAHAMEEEATRVDAAVGRLHGRVKAKGSGTEGGRGGN